MCKRCPRLGGASKPAPPCSHHHACMQASDRVLLLLDRPGHVFTRTWCLWEVMQASLTSEEGMRLVVSALWMWLWLWLPMKGGSSRAHGACGRWGRPCSPMSALLRCETAIQAWLASGASWVAWEGMLSTRGRGGGGAGQGLATNGGAYGTLITLCTLFRPQAGRGGAALCLHSFPLKNIRVTHFSCEPNCLASSHDPIPTRPHPHPHYYPTRLHPHIFYPT